jgi:hypothetical protein
MSGRCISSARGGPAWYGRSRGGITKALFFARPVLNIRARDIELRNMRPARIIGLQTEPMTLDTKAMEQNQLIKDRNAMRSPSLVQEY